MNKPLETSYGKIILQKGTRLYHASMNSLCSLPEKPMVFMTYHPSEWYMNDSHVSVIELQRDVSLLFMVSLIKQMRVYSSLNNYLINESNLAKMDYSKVKCWLPFLQKEGLDGWFSSIENKTAVEFAVINDPSILKLVECQPIQFDWKNSSYRNDQLERKNWGNLYTLSTFPVKMILNRRFQQQIEDYQKQIQDEDPDGTAFSLLLKNAEISYIDAPLKPIRWCLD
jgi:hypothetical protein